MFVGIGLNLVRGGGSASPASLFAASEPGAWYDPSDLTTLFQDSAGTTPVTGPNQTVGLMLDKSQGLVLGSELVANGDFSGGSTGWSVPAGWLITGGAAVAAATNASLLGGGLTPVSGRTYLVSFDVVSYTSGTLYVTVGGNFSGNPALTGAAMAVGRKSVYVTSGSSPSRGVEFYGGTIAATIDNISVKELAGNHATQATLGQRPTYGVNPITGTRNLLTYTEQFDNAIWTKSIATITANTEVAPDGTMTADRFVSTGGAYPQVYQYVSGLVAGQPYTFSVWVKSDGTTQVAQTLTLENSYSTAFTPTANWTRISVTKSSSAGGSQAPVILTNSATAPASSFLIWGAQVELGSTATAYQKVVTQYEVTEAGVQSASYLFFDGVDDGMVTGTITPGIDKVQVFAGVRKLSDAATAIIAETSVDSGANAGSFQVRAPNGASSANYLMGVRGSAAQALASFTTYTAPISNILTLSGDLAGDIFGRVNSVQTTIVNGTGGGNFLAYPLYLGRRGGSSLPFNGRLYSLIVRFGANLTTGQITSTESWVNGKTGAF